MNTMTIFEMFLEEYALQMFNLAKDSKDFELSAQTLQNVIDAYYKYKNGFGLR